MNARLLLKALFGTAAVCVALVVGLYLTALFINRNDEPPSAAAVRFEELGRKLPPLADSDNGYVYFVGISSDRERDPAVVGKARIMWAQAQLARPPGSPARDFPGNIHNISAARTSDIEQLFDKCQVADLACGRALKANEAKIAEWLEREKWFADRYSKLQTYPEWRETLPFDVRIPAAGYAHLLEAHRMMLLDAWLHAARGDVAGVKKMLADDIQFWRRNIALNDSLIAKLISSAALRRHFEWSNMILRHLPANRQAEAIPAQWHLAISDTERSMLRPFAGEWHYFMANIKLAKAGADAGTTLADGGLDSPLTAHLPGSFLQVQATSNRHAARLAELASILSAGYTQLPAAAQRARSLQENVGGGLLEHGAYNLVGNVLMDVGAWDATKYALRTADLEGIRRVVLLTAELRSRGVPADQVQAQLAVSAGSPYDGRPFTWDEAAQSIVFTGLGDGKFARTSVLY